MSDWSSDVCSSDLDSIVAEDLGKLPDQNVAESLQRIAGVTIERNRGEGRFVTVRGFGPKFNAVTVNGRTLATDNNGREFSFDVLPSEMIKLGRASCRERVCQYV